MTKAWSTEVIEHLSLRYHLYLHLTDGILMLCLRQYENRLL